MKKLIFALCLFSFSAQAEDSPWGKFTTSPVNGITWEYKKNSLDIVRGDSGVYWTYIFRTSKSGETKYDFVKVAVPALGCANKSGTMFLLNMSDEKQAEIQFVFDGETLGSNIAQQVCKQGDAVLKYLKEKENEPKPTSA